MAKFTPDLAPYRLLVLKNTLTGWTKMRVEQGRGQGRPHDTPQRLGSFLFCFFFVLPGMGKVKGWSI